MYVHRPKNNVVFLAGLTQPDQTETELLSVRVSVVTVLLFFFFFVENRTVVSEKRREIPSFHCYVF